MATQPMELFDVFLCPLLQLELINIVLLASAKASWCCLKSRLSRRPDGEIEAGRFKRHLLRFLSQVGFKR
jgi:hypothetical protein